MADSAPAERPATLAAQLDELESHLVSLEAAADPSQLFQADLFDRVNYQLGPVSYPDLTARFLPRLGLVLKKTAEAEATSQGWKGYPQPLVSLTIKLLRPVPFTDALGLCTPAYLITALGSPDENLNELALSILEKATASPPASSILAAVPGLLEALLSSWLLSPSVSVGQRGVVLLGDLLDVDCPRPQPVFTDDQKECLDIRLVARGPAQGHGAVWRRLFGAEEGLCWATLQKVEAELAGGDDDPKIRNQRTLAQDRLLRLLPRLAVLDISPLLTSTAPLGPQGQHLSLLDFATLHMADRHSDELVRLTWTDYMMKLIGSLRIADASTTQQTPQAAAAPGVLGGLAEVARRLVRGADDPDLIAALWGMPDNLIWTPLGEADAMRAWLREVAPRAAVRIGGFENGV